MTMTVTSPVTGAPVTGLTSPTYTFVTDLAPEANGKQFAVSTYGGTQTSVTASSASNPFTATFVRPKAYKALGTPNLVSGMYASVPRNTFKLITRKSVGINGTSGANVVKAVMNITTTFDVPAGSEFSDPTNVAACISAHLGILDQQSAGISDTILTGIF